MSYGSYVHPYIVWQPCVAHAVVVMDSKFYTIKFMDSIGLRSGYISIHFV
jgi:hypothetical protein